MFESTSDPTRPLRNCLFAIVLFGVVAVAAIALLLRPGAEEEVALSAKKDHAMRISQPQRNPSESVAPLDESVFLARLWNPPPPPSPPEPEEQTEPPKQTPPRRPPSNLELIAITTSHDSKRIAAVFDSRANTLYMVREGDTIEGLTILEIDETSLTMTAGAAMLHLELILPQTVSVDFPGGAR